MMFSNPSRSTRQPMQIYTDADAYDHAPMPSMNNSTDSTSPLTALKNTSSRRNVVLNPPSSLHTKQSPSKHDPQSSSSPTRPLFDDDIISMPPPHGSYIQTDSLQKKNQPSSTYNAGPPKALFTSAHAGKENYSPNMHPGFHGPYEGLQAGNFSLEGIFVQNGAKNLYRPSPQERTQLPQKRLMEAAPIHEAQRPLKQIKMEEPSLPAPVPDQFPILHDDGGKPGHSYATLIGMAILRAPQRRLTLSQIYKWISDTYRYYKADQTGWQNSIRHNLSLNKAFVKQERPKDDPGKGNYWAIQAGMEDQFLKEKSIRKGMASSDQIGPMSSTPAPYSQEMMQSSYKALMPATDLPQPSSSFIPSEPARTRPQDISSDATIPASDALVEETHEDDDPYVETRFNHPIHSSPPAMMHSSPPIAPRHSQSRSQDDTPPPVPRFHDSSRTRGSHKRGFASMDDSGYFSSLNSSALRGQGSSHQLTSEGDRPRKSMKRGRAEEAIARLRGSSYDSPTKVRNFMSQNNNYAPASSSPLRRPLKDDSNQMLPPLTPAVKLKAPVRPPPSVSPNTNLKNHRDRVRQLVPSPVRGLGPWSFGTPTHGDTLDDVLGFTPHFQIDDSYVSTIDFDADFNVFEDCNFDTLYNKVGDGSPEKKSNKRPRLEKSHSATILGEVSCNKKLNSSTTIPKLAAAPRLAPPVFESPCKGKMLASNSPSKSFDFNSPTKLLAFNSPNKFGSPSFDTSAFDLPTEDFFTTEFLADDVGEFDGVDILQGFQKIGAGSKNGQPTSSRPGFARSFTSRF